jgi:hypothetical protein
LYIKYTDNLSVSEIELHDIFGRTVKVFGKYQKVLNVSGLSSGVYFINIQTSEGVYNEKIIIE